MNNVDILFLFFSAVVGALAGFLIYFVVVYRARQKQNLREKRELLTAFHQEKLQATIEVQENTFRQVGRDLHDNIGQILGFARMQLNNGNANTKLVLEETDKLLGQAIAEVRAVSHSLHAIRLDSIGLVEACRDLLLQIEKSGQVSTKFECDNEPLPHLDAAIILFRMVQEVVNNILKHAQATLIHIKIGTSKSGVEIAISDNGIGFDTSAAGSGLGMRSLRDRAELASATISFHSAPGKGTLVKIKTR